MSLGSAAGVLAARHTRSPLRRFARKAYARLFGASDLHTHIRWRAIRRAIPQADSILDVGCGDGLLTVEVARRYPQSSVVGIDLSPKSIEGAEKTRQDLGTGNVQFRIGDVRGEAFGSVNGALMLDIIEHIDDDAALLKAVGEAVRGFVVISTPTPDFPRFFGREFHEAVGHVRAGYWPEQLAAMLDDAGFEVVSQRYYTKLPSALVCVLYYRFLWRGKAGLVLSPLLNLVSLLDYAWPFNGWACSNLVVARKR